MKTKEPNRKSFVFYVEWQEVLMEYPAEVRLEVYDAIIRYVASGTLSELKPLAKMAFSFMKKQIDINNGKYDDLIGKRSEAGRKGMARRYAREEDECEDTEGTEDLDSLTSDNKTNNGYQDLTNLTNGNKTNTAYQDLTNLTNGNKTNKPNNAYQTLTNLTPPNKANLYDNDHDNDNIILSPSPAPTREDTQQAMAGMPLGQCRRELEANRTWEETVVMNTRAAGFTDFTADDFRHYLTRFFAKLENEGETAKAPRDAMSHFARWLEIELSKPKTLKTNENRTKPKNRRRSDKETPASPEDYEGAF